MAAAEKVKKVKKSAKVFGAAKENKPGQASAGKVPKADVKGKKEKRAAKEARQPKSTGASSLFPPAPKAAHSSDQYQPGMLGNLMASGSEGTSGGSSLFAGLSKAPEAAAPFKRERKLVAVKKGKGQIKTVMKMTRTSEEQERLNALKAERAEERALEMRKASRKAHRQAGKQKKLGLPEEKEFRAQREDAWTRTVFVGNLPLGVDKQRVKQKLQKYLGGSSGPKIESCRIRGVGVKEDKLKLRWKFRDERVLSGECDSVNAFIVIADKADVPKAVKILHGMDFEVEGRRPYRMRAVAGSESGDDALFPAKLSVLVAGLPTTVNDEKLIDFFDQVGEVDAVRIIRDKVSRKATGTAFVKFKERKAAAAARKELHEQWFDSERWIKVYKMEDRKEHLAKKKREEEEEQNQYEIRKQRNIRKAEKNPQLKKLMKDVWRRTREGEVVGRARPVRVQKNHRKKGEEDE